MKKLDLINQRFGKWTALRPGNKPSHWWCRCECGTEKDVFIGSLRSGDSTKCIKCQGKEASQSGSASRGATKHGMHKSSEYRSWKTMRNRCYLTSHENFPYYGGRGITVCDRWKNSFENFYADMGPKPSPKHTIDRKDTNGNYEPDNCRWATVTEQNRNKQNSVYVEFKGRRVHLKEALELTGNVVKYDAAARRLWRGWDVMAALQTKTDKGYEILIDGKTLTLEEAATHYSVPIGTVRSRIYRGGWDVMRALTTPPRPLKRSTQ